MPGALPTVLAAKPVSAAVVNAPPGMPVSARLCNGWACLLARCLGHVLTARALEALPTSGGCKLRQFLCVIVNAAK